MDMFTSYGPRSHAIEMVFVFIETGHAGSSARSFMLSQKLLRLWVSDPVLSGSKSQLKASVIWSYKEAKMKSPIFL